MRKTDAVPGRCRTNSTGLRVLREDNATRIRAKLTKDSREDYYLLAGPDLGTRGEH